MSSINRKHKVTNDRYRDDRLKQDLKTLDKKSQSEKNDINPTKRSYKNRLYIGNLPLSVTESEFSDLFKNYKVESKHLLNGKGYGFVQLETREEAEKVRCEMDGDLKFHKVLRVKYCIPTAALKVRNLGPYVSNELLYQAFSMFGDLDRAIVIADDKGKSTGEGIVEFSSKRAYFAALRACTETCFLINNSLQPVIVEEYQFKDEEGGVPEATLTKHYAALQKDREKVPRLVKPGSFEFEYASRWKTLFEVEKAKKDAIEKEMEEAKSRLLEDIEAAYYEHQANLLREQLKELEEKTTLFQRNKTLRSSNWQEEHFRLEEEQRRLQNEHIRREEQRLQDELYRRQQQEQELRRQELMLKEEEAYRMQQQVASETPQVIYQGYPEPPHHMDGMHEEMMLNNHQHMMPPDMVPHPPPAPNMEEIMGESRSSREHHHRRSPPRRRHSKDRVEPYRRGAPERRSRSPRRRRH